MTMRPTGTGLDHADQDTLADADNSETNRIGQPDVYWPDPSPLQRWWNQVMEGSAIPRPRIAASSARLCVG
ncbi:hypothetical protein [Nocardia sp. CA-120079]|uniref:hypothetical protein n=1 Tax=Nocardia sp. CA-120079 TaxID=3239974 RepID=UPI003D9528DF